MITLTIPLLIMLLLSCYGFAEQRRYSRKLRALRAISNGRVYKHYDTSERPAHLHNV